MSAALEAFGREARRRRIERRLTQEEVAARAGLTVGCVGQVERAAKDVSLSTMQKLATGFGVPLGDLLPGRIDLSPAGVEFARRFDAVKNRRTRKAMLTVLRALAAKGGAP